jgi:hypothetical protein
MSVVAAFKIAKRSTTLSESKPPIFKRNRSSSGSPSRAGIVGSIATFATKDPQQTCLFHIPKMNRRNIEQALPWGVLVLDHDRAFDEKWIKEVLLRLGELMI